MYFAFFLGLREFTTIVKLPAAKAEANKAQIPPPPQGCLLFQPLQSLGKQAGLALHF